MPEVGVRHGGGVARSTAALVGASLRGLRLPPRPGSVPDGPVAVVGRLSQAQRANWERWVESPWVLDTVLRGYKLQFRCRPPSFRGVRVTALPSGEMSSGWR